MYADDRLKSPILILHFLLNVFQRSIVFFIKRVFCVCFQYIFSLAFVTFAADTVLEMLIFFELIEYARTTNTKDVNRNIREYLRISKLAVHIISGYFFPIFSGTTARVIVRNLYGIVVYFCFVMEN